MPRLVLIAELFIFKQSFTPFLLAYIPSCDWHVTCLLQLIPSHAFDCNVIMGWMIRHFNVPSNRPLMIGAIGRHFINWKSSEICPVTLCKRCIVSCDSHAQSVLRMLLFSSELVRFEMSISFSTKVSGHCYAISSDLSTNWSMHVFVQLKNFS